MRPPLTHEDAHGAFEDVEDVVFRVGVRARTLGVWLKPPFGDGVARFALNSVSFKDGRNAPHGIGTALAGTENHSFTGRGARLTI